MAKIGVNRAKDSSVQYRRQRRRISEFREVLESTLSLRVLADCRRGTPRLPAAPRRKRRGRHPTGIHARISRSAIGCPFRVISPYSNRCQCDESQAEVLDARVSAA